MKNVIIVSSLIFPISVMGSLGHSKLVLAEQLTSDKQQKYQEQEILAEQLMRELFLRKNEVQIRVEKPAEQSNTKISKPVVVSTKKILAKRPETIIQPVAKPVPKVVTGPDNTQIEETALAKQMADLKQAQQKTAVVANIKTKESITKSSRQSAAS